MPELPEVEALARYLGSELAGRTVSRVDVVAFSALKTFDPPIDDLRGATVVGTGRRGKWLLIEMSAQRELTLALHLARGGWVRWKPHAEATGARPKGGKSGLALRLGFEGGGVLEVTEAGTEKRLAVHLVGAPGDVPRIASLGVDPLDPEVSVDELGRLLAGASGHLKNVLTEQEVIAGIGNAYSDEILHVARLSPFKPASKLEPAEVERLHEAIGEVLRDAVERSVGLEAGNLKGEKKSAMRVHGREGEPCPACGDTVRSVNFATSSLQYCPTCQTGGKQLADRRLSRLLK